MTEMEPRRFLKAYIEAEEKEEGEDKQQSDQQKGIPVPALQKPVPEGAPVIELVPADHITVGNKPLFDIIRQRKSRRRFTSDSLTLEELSFLLYATQGVKRTLNDKSGRPHSTLRTSPSGGARHPFETYLYIRRVTGLEPGMYRYLPLDHTLCFLYADADLPAKIAEGCCGQTFVGTGAVVFIWTTIPYRMEWRYLPQFGSKIIAQDSGHLCQNLYLASEAIGCGTCAIGAYLQEKMDALVQVDGVDEFTIYVAPVGRIQEFTSVTVSPEQLGKYAGGYSPESRPERVLNVVFEDGILYIVPSDGSRFKMTPISETEFQIDIADDVMKFVKDQNGDITGFRLDQAGDVFFVRKKQG